ncbi:uncharacterized protein LOC117897186 [Drosophila subobscura]|uniref:uncharacterized protein LOC117897186 n=1 Tax=Drosophila subobscura TaxID=7241 RepID=UPI00155A9134|nr:uncharacterized protein LOC117897186 [Drosophila subobscura]
MKLQVTICCLVVFACCAVDAYSGNGQPGCKTQMELEISVFRNNWDATSYWKCDELNAPATQMKCPDEMGFVDSLKNCVSWDEWEWETPVAPLSEVDE